jgi:hypothetical protein
MMTPEIRIPIEANSMAAAFNRSITPSGDETKWQGRASDSTDFPDERTSSFGNRDEVVEACVKGQSPSGPLSGCRDVQSLGGGERSIVLKFTGAAIDFDRVESHPCCRLLLAKSVACVFRSPIVRKNHAVPSTIIASVHSRALWFSCQLSNFVNNLQGAGPERE